MSVKNAADNSKIKNRMRSTNEKFIQAKGLLNVVIAKNDFTCSTPWYLMFEICTKVVRKFVNTVQKSSKIVVI